MKMVRIKRKFQVECRHGQFLLYLPCNWVKDGFCGADGKKCNAKIRG